jgi:putative glutamine amidotransferase
VNSCHHQGVKRLPTRFAACACAPDGLVEAARLAGKRYVAAVQWHPECALEKVESKALFSDFVEARKGRA